jgi:hypothetical protein
MCIALRLDIASKANTRKSDEYLERRKALTKVVVVLTTIF